MSLIGLKYAKLRFDQLVMDPNPVQFVLIVAGATDVQLAQIKQDLTSFTTQIQGRDCTFEFDGVDNVFTSRQGWEAPVAQYGVEKYLRRYPDIVFMLFKTNQMVNSTFEVHGRLF